MNTSYPYDPDLHEAGSLAAQGGCSYHAHDTPKSARCAGPAVVSYADSEGQWQSGCSLALEQLVERGHVTPLGQGA